MSFASLEEFQLLSYDKQYCEIIKILKFIYRNKEDLIPERLDKKILWLYLIIEDIWYENINPADMLWLYWSLNYIIQNFSDFDLESIFSKIQYIQVIKNKNKKKVWSIFNF